MAKLLGFDLEINENQTTVCETNKNVLIRKYLHTRKIVYILLLLIVLKYEAFTLTALY